MRAAACSARRSSQFAIASVLSSSRSYSPESYTFPAAVWYGNCSGWMKFLRRTSAGSSPSSRASSSIDRSTKKIASGIPAPRYASVGILFVNTSISSDRITGIA